jgi:hypothetical protein
MVMPGQSHLDFFEHSDRFVILRSAATKDLRLFFGVFSAKRRGLGIIALPTFTVKQRRTIADPSLRSGWQALYEMEI